MGGSPYEQEYGFEEEDYQPENDDPYNFEIDVRDTKQTENDRRYQEIKKQREQKKEEARKKEEERLKKEQEEEEKLRLELEKVIDLNFLI